MDAVVEYHSLAGSTLADRQPAIHLVNVGLRPCGSCQVHNHAAYTNKTCCCMFFALCRAVASGSSVPVVCARNGLTAFLATFSVTLTATGGSPGCNSSSSFSSVVTSTCCTSNAVYARNPSAPTCTGTVGCSSGFINSIAASTATAALTSFPFAAGNCSKQAPAGSVQVKCVTVSAQDPLSHWVL